MEQILTTGSIGLDTTRTPFKAVERVLGGSCSYFSVSASYFASVHPIAVVGNDFPREYLELLKGRNVDVRGIKVEEGKTFSYDSTFGFDFYDRKQNSLDFGVFANFDPVVPERLRNSKHVFLATLSPKLQLKFLQQLDNPKTVFMDTISYYVEHERKDLEVVLKKVDGIVVNDIEAREFCKTPSLVSAGKKLLQYGLKVAIIKKGEHGCIVFTENDVLPFPAIPLEEIVDPTGAGDSFAGGFMGIVSQRGNLSSSTLKSAIAHANVMGSFAVQDFSLNKLASLTSKDIEKRLNEYKKSLCLCCEDGKH